MRRAGHEKEERPRQGHGMDRGLEVGMSLCVLEAGRAQRSLEVVSQWGGRPRMRGRGRQGPDPAEPCGWGCAV